MARFNYVPHDEDREDQKVEEKAARKAMFNDEATNVVELHPRFGELDPNVPEFATVEDFTQFMCDDDRTEYDHHELACVQFRTGLRVWDVQAALSGYGLKLKRRLHERTIRGFSANPHNRWTGAQ